MEGIEAYARREGCVCTGITGRKGWLRVARRLQTKTHPHEQGFGLMAAPNSLSAYDLLRRAIEQQRAQQPGVDWNSPSLVSEQNPDGDQAPQGLLGRLRALLAEQSQYQPVAGVDEYASARLSDPNFRQLSRAPTASQPQAARFEPFLEYAPALTAPIFATAPPEPRATPPALAGLVRSAYDQLADQPRRFPTSYGNSDADLAAMMPETYVPPGLADWNRQAAPKDLALIRDIAHGIVTLPKRAIEAAAQDVTHLGDHSYEPQLTGPAIETALLPMGTGAIVGTNALRTVGNAAKTLESRSAGLYNPPDKLPRPFEADYPAGGIADESGRLQFDIEGRPLVGAHISGRRMVRGADEAILPSEYASISEGSTGKVHQALEAGALPRGSVGAYREVRGPEGPERSIGYLKTLTPSAAERVVSHELGHAFDELAGQIPTAGLNSELRQLYNTLNTGQERTTRLTGPQHMGYGDREVPRELMAEAIRAYMVNPNYIKTVAPKTAARIREYVNNNPRINQTIQFNSGVAGVLGTGAVAGVPRNDDR